MTRFGIDTHPAEKFEKGGLQRKANLTLFLHPFQKIARQLKVSVDAVTFAYDQGQPHALKEAVERGQRPKRGHYSHLPKKSLATIRQGLQTGKDPKLIAADAGCSVQTVLRMQKEFRESAKE